MAQENYNTFDFTPYESNFATGRREELADRTREEFDTNKAEHDILKRTIGALEVTDANKYHIDQMNDDIDKTMQGVLETGRYDLASFAVSDSLTRFMTDNVVKNAVEGFQTRKKEKQLIAANPDKFHDYNIVPARVDLDTGQKLTAAEYNDPAKMQNSRVMFDPTTQAVEYIDLSEGHDAKDGAYLGNSEEIKNHQAKAYEMMKSIATDPTHYKYVKAVANAYGVTDDIAKKFIMSGKAVTEGKVQGLAEELLQMYSDTPEGLQRARDLARKVSSNVEELSVSATGMSPGMSIPVMNTNSPEEIQAALLNDLVTAGQTQIGVTQTLRDIPQDRVGPKVKPPTTPYDFSRTIEVTKERQKIIDARKRAKARIAEKNSVMFSNDGSLKTETKKLNPLWAAMDTKERTLSGESKYITENDTETFARVTAELAAINSNNPLDLAGDYERAVYIKNSGQFDYLKTDKDNKPIEVSDVDFIYAVEESLANAKYVSEVLYQFRDASSQKGSVSGFKGAAQHLIDLLKDPGTLIFDQSSDSPETGLQSAQWSANEAGPLTKKETPLNNLIEQLSNYVKGESTNTTNPTGITLNNASPGAIRVIYKGKTLNIQTGERLKKMLEPAAALINLVKNPLDGGKVALPDIATERTPEEIEKGIFTVVEAAPRSTGSGDNFQVNVEWYTYKEDADGNPVSNSKPLPPAKVNEFVETAVLTAMQFGPDTSKTLRDTSGE